MRMYHLPFEAVVSNADGLNSRIGPFPSANRLKQGASFHSFSNLDFPNHASYSSMVSGTSIHLSVSSAITSQWRAADHQLHS